MKNTKSKKSLLSRVKNIKRPVLVAIVAVLAFASVGTYKLAASHAASVPLNVYGCPTSAYWSKRPTLYIGQKKNGCAKTLQNDINKIFKNPHLLVVDGSFGPATQAWVMAIQRQSGLNADGYVGHDTWAYVTVRCLVAYPNSRC